MAAKLNQYTDHQIVVLLDSQSNSETEEPEKRVSKIQSKGTLRLKNTAKDVTDTDSDLENVFEPKYILAKKKDSEKDNVSLRIKLRRSTEQSLYKIDTDSEYEKSSRKPRSFRSRLSRKQKESSSEVESEGSCTDSRSNSKKVRSKGEKERAEDSCENDVARTPRIRRPPLRFSSYHCSTLSPLSLRSRQNINYNEDTLFVNSLVSNVNGERTLKKQKENKVLNLKRDTANKALTPSTKSNKRNRIPSVKDTENDSGTDSKVAKPKSMRKSDDFENDAVNDLPCSPEMGNSTKEEEARALANSTTPVKVDRQKRAQSESVRVTGKSENKQIDANDEECLTDMYKRIKISSRETATPVRVAKQRNIVSERTPRNVKSVRGSAVINDVENFSSANRGTLTPRRKDNARRKIDSQLEEVSLSTPKSRSVKRNALTPSMGKRSSALLKPATPLQEARSRLHVSAVPKSLPCREEEFNDIFTFLKGKLEDKSGGCIYISGVPGTGKTATVNEAVRCLRKLILKGQLDDFDYVAINGMKLTEPRQSYVQILKQLSGRTVTWEQAYHALEKRFHSANSKMTLLLVDELDFLCTKRQDVIYNLLDWPTKATAQLVVVTIANTMDLPERVLMGRVTSRLGLTRLTFQPYNYKQLQEIVMSRLRDFHGFRSEAIQLVARKVSAVSGDARRALDICRRAMEIAESRCAERVSLQDVSEAVGEMIASAKVQAIKHCSRMEQIFLRAVAAEVTRTSVEEVYFKDAYRQLESLCSFDGVRLPTVTEVLAVCGRLGAARLLICDHSRNDIYQKTLLNVSADDIHYATQEFNLNGE